jgi:hypothetical protein
MEKSGRASPPFIPTSAYQTRWMRVALRQRRSWTHPGATSLPLSFARRSPRKGKQGYLAKRPRVLTNGIGDSRSALLAATVFGLFVRFLRLRNLRPVATGCNHGALVGAAAAEGPA